MKNAGRETGARVDHMLTIVENNHDVSRLDVVLERFEQRTLAILAHP
jgi:hypothetical protein